MKSIFIIFILFSKLALSQDTFIEDCPKYSAAFSAAFNNKSCAQVKLELKKLKSFSEFIYSDRESSRVTKYLASSWTDSFPYMHGVNRKILSNQYATDHVFRTNGYDFGTLEIFKSFKNLTHLTYTPEYKYYKGIMGICRLLKNLPQLKTLTLEKEVLQNPFSDHCIAESNVEGVIIHNKFEGFKTTTPKSKILGIEFFAGKFEDIKDLKDLKYLGVSSETNTLDGLDALYSASRISHLSINIKNKIADLEKIQFLINLESLNLTCIKNESLNSPTTDKCRKDAAIQDVGFLKDLPWLSHLDLSFNQIQNVDPLKNLNRLEFLKLRGNKVNVLPDLNKFPKLRYLDLSGNEIVNISGVLNSKDLYFLNLSGNQISDLSPLSGHENIKYLNASAQQTVKPLIFPENMSSLAVLNINGAGGHALKESLSDFSRMPAILDKESEINLYMETLHFDFNLEQGLCTSSSNVKNDLILKSFPNLEVLYVKNNELIDLNFVKNLPRLKYINADNNRLRHFDPEYFSKDVERIILTSNSIRSVENLSNLSKLEYLNLGSNEISDVKSARFPDSLKALDLQNNFIEDVNGLTTLNSEEIHLNLAYNLIPKSEKNCPSSGTSKINNVCASYLSNKDSIISNFFLEFPGAVNIKEIHKSLSCNIEKQSHLTI